MVTSGPCLGLPLPYAGINQQVLRVRVSRKPHLSKSTPSGTISFGLYFAWQARNPPKKERKYRERDLLL
jgi:hypothetical protein